ncbi:MAG: hypothetical protein Q8L69_12165 [Gallionellaceae bacterium]|nr:hypothetical protein [Gallionellaceae bacterium]
MKQTILVSAVCVLATYGCSTSLPFGLGSQTPSGEPVAAPARPAEAEAKRPQQIASQAQRAVPEPTLKPAEPPPDNHPAPDAVIKLNPGSDRLSGDMEARLVGIAQIIRDDDRLMLRLESYVPDGGSPELNLGIAEQALQVVKKRLVELKVSTRRIFLAPFGEEHRAERDQRMHWVEIYLIRPRL